MGRPITSNLTEQPNPEENKKWRKEQWGERREPKRKTREENSERPEENSGEKERKGKRGVKGQFSSLMG